MVLCLSSEESILSVPLMHGSMIARRALSNHLSTSEQSAEIDIVAEQEVC